MKPINTLPPFKRLCVTIGNLPSSYVDSMSYYECLMWLCKYLKETVIPAINENAEAVKEIQDWIKNLDLQDEVDNKLDEMAESGELQEIISEYLNSTAVFGFGTVQDMKEATNLINGSYARTTGYHSINDGGSATYKIRTVTNDDVVDDMLIIEMADDSLVAELLKPYTPEKMGAYADGTHDDSDVIDKYFKTLTANEHVHLTGNYGLSKAIQLPLPYGITIDGGTFTALSGFDNTVSNALLYIIGGSIVQPDGYGVSSTGLRLSNITFMCEFISDGIEMNRALNMNIDKCLFLKYKNYGINETTMDSHDLVISGCQFRGNPYNGDTSNLSNIGIRIYGSDSVITSCIFANGYGGIEVLRGANLIENCHFYAHQNHGFNLKLGSYENIVSGCYFDGGSLYLSSGWRNRIIDSLFVASNTTEYMVKVGTDSPNSHQVSFIMDNNTINDERSDKTTPINFITYEEQVTDFSNTKITNTQFVSPTNVVLNNPFNGIQINDENPTFLGLSKYVADINMSNYSIGSFTSIDGETEHYKARCSGNTVESSFIGASTFYKYLVIPFVVTEKTRIIANLTSTGNATAFFYDSNHNFISYNKATLEAGLYYMAIYKTVSVATLKVNS